MLKWLIFLFPLCTWSQLKIIPKYDSVAFSIHKKYALSQDDSVQVEELKFYLSDIIMNHHPFSKDKFSNVWLFDAEDTLTFSIPAVPIYGKRILKFSLGMDSVLNTSGTLTGPFDPLLGMYWAWNTGYIHIKCSGIVYKKGKSFPFEYHIGGYREPYGTCNAIEMEKTQDIIALDMQRFLNNLPYYINPRIMIPGSEAKKIHELFSTCFY